MTQPLDRNCDLPALGELDSATGEFWTGRSRNMTRNRENTSAFERNRLFLNNGKPEFIDVSFAAACDIDADSRSAIAADFDRDGATDLLVASVGGGPLRLFRNQTPSENHSVTIRLFGTRSNVGGIGSRMTLQCGGKTIIRDMFPPNGCLGLGPPEQTIGVGSATKIDRLTIRWPSGFEQSFEELPIDGLLFIQEENDKPRFRSFQMFKSS